MQQRTGYSRSSQFGEVAASTAGDVLLSETDLPTGSTIGILEPVSPGVQAAVTELEQSAGRWFQYDNDNSQYLLSGDNAAANAEAAAAVSQFNAEGAQQVFVLLPFINTEGFREIGKLQPDWDVSIIDVGPGNALNLVLAEQTQQPKEQNA